MVDDNNDAPVPIFFLGPEEEVAARCGLDNRGTS